MKRVTTALLLFGLAAWPSAVQSISYSEFSELERILRRIDHVVVVEITRSSTLKSAEATAWWPCAIVYSARVVESLGPRLLEGEIDFASDEGFKTGRRYLLFLSAATTALGDPSPFAQMFLARSGREGCASELRGLLTDETPPFEIREVRETLVDEGRDSWVRRLYVPLDSGRITFPETLKRHYEQFRICAGIETGKTCGIRWETTLIEWEALRDYIKSYFREMSKAPR